MMMEGEEEAKIFLATSFNRSSHLSVSSIASCSAS